MPYKPHQNYEDNEYGKITSNAVCVVVTKGDRR